MREGRGRGGEGQGEGQCRGDDIEGGFKVVAITTSVECDTSRIAIC